MGVHLSPVGPLPASVYWRRRAVLLLALFLGLFLLRACTGGEQAPATESLGATPVTPAASPATSASNAPTPSASPAPTPTPTPTAAAECADDDLVVRAVADQARYRVGERPRLTLRIANGGAQPCRRGIGSGSVELQVLSGPDRIWSSDDCGGEGPAGVVTLPPRRPEATTVAWDGRRSRPGCPGAGEQAEPGTYRLVGRVGELVVEGDVFTVVP